MSIEKNNSIYTAADIKKYLTGGMSNAEMYAIEKAALDDPFLSEAIEGYEAMEEKDWSKELAALKQKLETVENAPIVPIYKTAFIKWWKATAAVLVIGSSVVAAYLFTSKKVTENNITQKTTTTNDSVTIAKVDSAVINTTAASTVTPAVTAQNNFPTTTSGFADSIRQTLPTDLAVVEKREDNFVYTPSPGKAVTENKDMAPGRSENESDRKANADIAAPSQGNNANAQLDEMNKSKNRLILQDDKAADNYRFKNNANNYYFNAQVVTADNKPLAFANVAVPKTNNPVYTDANGNLKLSAADSTVNVVVTSAGYLPQKFKLQNSAVQNKIVLQPNDIATKEISVSKKRSTVKAELKKEAVNAEMDEEEDAEPAGGWIEYNNYLSNNLVFPNEAKQNNIHGEVEVFVKLKNNGDISKVKVDKSLCPECDAEAIRLVKEGPKWEVKKNKAAKAKVKVKF